MYSKRFYIDRFNPTLKGLLNFQPNSDFKEDSSWFWHRAYVQVIFSTPSYVYVHPKWRAHMSTTEQVSNKPQTTWKVSLSFLEKTKGVDRDIERKGPSQWRALDSYQLFCSTLLQRNIAIKEETKDGRSERISYSEISATLGFRSCTALKITSSDRPTDPVTHIRRS